MGPATSLMIAVIFIAWMLGLPPDTSTVDVFCRISDKILLSTSWECPESNNRTLLRQPRSYSLRLSLREASEVGRCSMRIQEQKLERPLLESFKQVLHDLKAVDDVSCSSKSRAGQELSFMLLTS